MLEQLVKHLLRIVKLYSWPVLMDRGTTPPVSTHLPHLLNNTRLISSQGKPVVAHIEMLIREEKYKAEGENGARMTQWGRIPP